MKIISHANAKKKTKRLKGFKFCIFYWSFSSDTLAMKGLIETAFRENLNEAADWRDTNSVVIHA